MSTKRVLCIDLDGKIENLALMRVSTYHKSLGDKVALKVLHGSIGAASPRAVGPADTTYISTLFSWNKTKAILLNMKWSGLLGGSGISATSRLPQEIEHCKPDYSLYGMDRALGFISRGCDNACPWCIVWRKEGALHRVSTAEEIVTDKAEAIFLDNNFLALSGHESDLLWLIENEVKIDFNQGLDAAFVTQENAELLSRCKWTSSVRLAMDSDDRIDVVSRAVSLLNGAGIRAGRIMVYVLIGFSGLESDISRLIACRELGVSAFPMGYRTLKTGREPARGWDKNLYRKYRRLICRVPHSSRVWDSFYKEVVEPMG